MDPIRRARFAALGPGLLFAGAAVGVSHIVQSTRAGASFGLGLLLVVIVANILKYPAFAFGPHYAAATGRSLLDGYRQQGRWALVVYALLTVGTMFTVQAAVTLVTAGLAIHVLGLSISAPVVATVILVIAGAIVGVGQYKLLDRVVRVIVAVLTVATITATVLVLSRVDWGGPWIVPTDQWDAKTAFIVAALVGWMPSAIDVAVWHSLWTLARRRASGHAPSVADARFDFNVGYIGTAALAVCFLLLGAGVMHGTGTTFAPGAAGFAGQVVDLFAQTLGEWSRPVIGAAALGVMISTTLTVIDGFPRAIACLLLRTRGPEPEGGEELSGSRYYWLGLAVLSAGSVAILFGFTDRLKALVDLATTLSFLTAPILAILNHRAVFSTEVPAERRPTPRMRIYSFVGIASLSALALGWLWVRFVAG